MKTKINELTPKVQQKDEPVSLRDKEIYQQV